VGRVLGVRPVSATGYTEFLASKGAQDRSWETVKDSLVTGECALTAGLVSPSFVSGPVL
jgi:hypothetical protein